MRFLALITVALALLCQSACREDKTLFTSESEFLSFANRLERESFSQMLKNDSALTTRTERNVLHAVASNERHEDKDRALAILLLAVMHRNLPVPLTTVDRELSIDRVHELRELGPVTGSDWPRWIGSPEIDQILYLSSPVLQNENASCLLGVFGSYFGYGGSGSDASAAEVIFITISWKGEKWTFARAQYHTSLRE